MSKLDAQRAMREAKYARLTASRPEAAAGGGTPVTPAPRTPRTRPAQAATAAPAAAGPEGERCGHKSMNGRACTRDTAHSEKSHRYG